MSHDITYNSKDTPLLWIIIQAGSIWVMLDIGYYVFLPILGLSTSYTGNPIGITSYYIFWIGFTLFSFWNLYSEWKFIDQRWYTYVLLLCASIVVVAYLTLILPFFPALQWATSARPPSEILYATPWYFLPKSIDILLQQLLVVAMVLSFHFHKYSIKTISIWCAALFGGAHLLLVFGDRGVSYVIAFTLSAICASFVFPYLILKVKNGIIYSYLLHWLFYAVIIVIARLIT